MNEKKYDLPNGKTVVFHYDDNGVGKVTLEAMDALMEMIKELPSAQPEIIRCKDCIYRDPEDKKCDCGHAILWNLPRDDDWFCADAKRRTHKCGDCEDYHICEEYVDPSETFPEVGGCPAFKEKEGSNDKP